MIQHEHFDSMVVINRGGETAN